ncbi:MAG: polysaccharide deacetylase family protein [Planctomycetaceae bacterium]
MSNRFRFLFSFLIVGGFSALLLATVPDGKINPRYLMVHTDDAGMCHSMNVATIESLERGLVTSASVMPPCPGFDEFAIWAKSHPEYDYGVHLTLTNETRRFTWGPVLPKNEVSSLVDADGFFWRTSQEVAGHAELEHVEKELRAQIEKALDAGIKITHLDNHMYSLLGREDLIDAYVSLGLEYDLPVRFRNVETMPLKQRAEFHGGLLDAYSRAGNKLIENKMPLFTYAESDNYDAAPDDKRNHFLESIRTLPAGVSEFIIHCGSKGETGPEPPTYQGDRRIFECLILWRSKGAEETRYPTSQLASISRDSCQQF